LRTDDAAEALLARILELPPKLGLGLTGIAAYEGVATTADPAESARRVDDLIGRLAGLHARVRQRLGPSVPLILTAGGSLWFDRVLDLLGPLARGDGRTRLMLRSGAVFFGDHGVYLRGLSAMADRGMPLAGRIGGALRLWAEVLSLPEPGLAIAGLGMRDVATDQGMPVALHQWRDGRDIGPRRGSMWCACTTSMPLSRSGRRPSRCRSAMCSNSGSRIPAPISTAIV